MTQDPLIPVVNLIEGRSRRWVADACRLGRVPRAVRVGKVWFLRRSDYERWVSAPDSVK